MVLTILWTLVVGLVTWDRWPTAPSQILSIFPAGAKDQNSGTMPTIGYYEALAKLARGGPVPIGFEVPQVPAGFIPDTPNAGLVIAIPTVGKVRFPSSMSQDQVQTASKKLYDEHQNLIQDINRKELQGFRARRLAVESVAAVLWLLPPVALYGLGCSTVWVYRGFKTTKPDP